MNIYCRILSTVIFCILCSGKADAQFKDGVYFFLNTNTGQYLGIGGSNGAQATLVKHEHPLVLKAVNDSLYTIDTHVYMDDESHFLGTNLNLKSKETTWQFIETSNGNYAITCDKSNYICSDGSSTYINTTTNKNNRRAQWKIINEEDRILALKEGSDATFLIRNADFFNSFTSGYNESYWTIGGTNVTSDINLSAGNPLMPCASAYHTPFDVFQDLEAIPCGTYSLQGQGFYRLDGTRTSYYPELYIDEEADIFFNRTQNENSVNEASASFSMNLYEVKDLKSTTYNGTIRIGARLERSNTLWCCWDNLTLTYVKDLDLAGYKKAFAFSNTEAEGIIKEAINQEIKDSLKRILKSKDFIENENTVESYKKYVYALNKELVLAKKSINYYNNFFESYNRYTNLDETGQELFLNLAEEVYYRYEDCIITDAKEEIQFLDSIYIVATKAQKTPGTDMTAAIVNPDVNGTTGWTCEKPNGGNGPLLNNASFEYWAGSNIKDEDRSFNYYQTITGLQNGKYTISCQAYNSRSSTDNAFVPSCGLYAISGNDTVKVLVEESGSTLSDFTTPEIIVTDSTLTIGVKNFGAMPARWFVADSFRLTLIENEETVTGIGNLPSSKNKSDGVSSIYSVNGIKRNKTGKGINIVKYKNGEVKKIIL